MRKIQSPESFVKLILALRSNFTRPVFRHLQVGLSAILLGSPGKTITACIRLLGVVGHFCNVHRFLGLYNWELTNVVCDLLVFALDGTLVPKYGPKIFGRATHFDHAARANPPK